MTPKPPAGPPPVRAITRDTIEWMLIAALLRPDFRKDCVRMLKPSHFHKSSEIYLATLWDCVLTLDPLYPDRKRIPYVAVYDLCREVATADDSQLPPDQQAQLLATPDDGPDVVVGLVHHAYHACKPSQFTEDWARRTLKRFLTERGPFQQVRAAVEGAVERGQVLTDFLGTLEAARRLGDDIASLDGDDGLEGFDIDLDRVEEVMPTPTGISFLDTPLSGGTKAPEMIGILGPTGGGKSTLVAQAISSRAAVFQALDRDRPRTVFLFTFEDNFRGIAAGGKRVAQLTELWSRMIANVANVPKEEVMRPSRYSTRGALKPYELALYGHLEPALIEGERERIDKAQEFLNRNVRIGDMTKDGRGTGGVDEIVSFIGRDLKKHRNDPGTVFIDSLDLLVSNQLMASGKDLAKNLTLAIVTTVAAVRKRIGAEFGVDVWVTNQLAGEQNKRTSNSKMGHADGANAKGWANALDFSFAYPPLDEDSRCSRLRCSKSRRGGGNGTSTIVRLDGPYGRWVDASEEYVVHQQQFVKKSLYNGLVAEAPRVRERSSRATEVEEMMVDELWGDVE